MDIRHVDESYHVSPQISQDEVAALAAAGFSTVICNRPDAEVPPALQAAALRPLVEDAGMRFHVLPLTHQTMTPENIAEQARLVAEAEGPVLAYCASGTRSTVVWSLGQAMAGARSADEILAKAAAAGYDLAGLRPQLELLQQG